MRPPRPDAARPVVRTPAGRPRPASAATRARARRRRVGTAALGALAVLVVGAALPHASASRLEVRAERAGIVTRTACTTTAVEVVPDSASAPTAVTLDGLTAIDAAACSGAPVAVTLFGAAGVLGTAEGTLTGAGQAYDLTGGPAASDVTRVRVLVGGFALPAAWRLPGPPPDSCRVLAADGTPTDQPCDVTSSQAGGWWHGGTGVGIGQWTWYIDAPLVGVAEFIEFQLTVPREHQAIPGWWSWDGAVVVTVNNDAVITSRCGELPTIRGNLPPNKGGMVNVYVEFHDSVGGGAGAICRP